MYLLRDVRVLFVVSLLAACGCGEKPAAKSQSDPGANAAGSNLTSDNPAQSNVSQPAAGARGAGASAGNVSKTPAKPSPAQIARWELPAYAPLRLLACYDGFGDPAVECMAASPDGKQFVLGGAKLTLWNRQNSEPAAELLANYKREEVERPIRSVAVSADGNWLAAGDEKGTVRIWTLSDRHEVVAFHAHDGHLTQLAFSPDSRLLATTSYSGDVHLWQLPEGKKLKSLKMDKYEIRHLMFLSENQLASAGSEASLWNVETGTKETALTTRDVIGPALGLSSDRRLLAFNDADSALQFWDVQKSKATGLALRGAGAHLIAFSKDAKWIATYSNNSEIRIWDAARGAVMQVIDADGGRTSALTWLPDCSALLVASEQGRLRIWGTADDASTIGIEPIPLPTPTAPA